jgi:hypothetical protein
MLADYRLLLSTLVLLWLGSIRGADEACVLYAIYCFSETDDALNFDRHPIAFDPDIEDVADFGFTIAWKYHIASARVA